MKTFAAILFALFGIAPLSASAADDVMIVYDGSNSMWGQIDGTAKIEIARDVMADLIETWPQSTNLGLIAYGHRREGDCTDIEMMVAPAPVEKKSFLETVNSIVPRGRTPLTTAVEQAAEALSYRDNPATVVLISDGVETCRADPCALAEKLEKQGVAFTAHVVGFDLSREEHEQLSCIADNTGGLFVPAENADELRMAMSEVQEVIEAETEAELEPEPELPQVTLTGPDQVTAGATFELSWTGTINPSDFLTIVPAGSDEGKVGGHIRAGDNSEGRLTAPGMPGLYELRYVLEEGRHTLASAAVEVIEGEVTLTGPDQVTAGATFDFSWTGTINPADFLTIVPAGSDEGKVDGHIRAGDNSEGRLTAPGMPGLYELRYVLEEGRHTLASATVEVVEGEVGITSPATVRAGADIDVTWTGTINPSDFITIVPAGSDEGKVDSHIRARDNSEGRLTAPDTPGIYEVRYVLEEGRHTLASSPVEVVAADAPLDDGAGLSAPATAAPGETITVAWTIPADDADRRVALAEAEAPDFTWISAHRVGSEQKTEITLPDEPGRYEVRFLDIGGQSVLGRAIISVGE